MGGKMKEKFAYYQQMVDEIGIKLSTEECNYLLKEKNGENKKLFMAHFIRYIFNMSKKIFLYYQDIFVGSYDFDDFISDAYLVVFEIYDVFICQCDDGKINLFNFINECRQKIINNLANTFAFKTSWSTWKQIYEIKKIQEFYRQNNGEDISLTELMKITGYSEKVLKKIMNLVCVNYNIYLDGSFEDEIIDRVDTEEIYSDLIKIEKLSPLKLETLCMIYGLQGYNPLNMSELAQQQNLSRNAIHLRCKKALQVIRENDDFVKKYTK